MSAEVVTYFATSHATWKPRAYATTVLWPPCKWNPWKMLIHHAWRQVDADNQRLLLNNVTLGNCFGSMVAHQVIFLPAFTSIQNKTPCAARCFLCFLLTCDSLILCVLDHTVKLGYQIKSAWPGRFVKNSSALKIGTLRKVFQGILACSYVSFVESVMVTATVWGVFSLKDGVYKQVNVVNINKTSKDMKYSYWDRASIKRQDKSSALCSC